MSTRTFSWNSNSYLLDGKPFFMVSGEFHYFRVPKTDWKKRLQLFKKAGGNSVATYVPWLLHEPQEGDIRFGDQPYRDLDGFLKLCKKLDILVTVRPGPYQYSEMLFDGLPGWLCEKYPQILARNAKGEIFRKSSVSYLHPLFLEKARTWYRKAAEIISKHTLSKGGAVAFAQFDNELMGIHEWFGSWDYNAETMGFGKADGRFPKFLASRYGTPEKMNAAWGTQFADFASAKPFDGGKPNTVEERRRSKDYQDFYYGTIAEYAETLVGWMREDGIDCDIVHNSANPYMNSYFTGVVERLREKGVRFILGSDHYYNLDQDWDQNNPTPKYACKNFYSNEMLRLLGMPSTVYELPGGSASDWPPISSEDLLCSYMLNVAFGMKGSNYYIFTGGPNPEHIGCFDDVYDFQAAVAADGTIRPTYKAMKKFGAFLADNAWLAGARHVSDFYLGLAWEFSRSPHYFSTAGDSLAYSNIEAWNFSRKGIMTSSLCAGWTPEFVEVDRGDVPIPTGKPLFMTLSVALSAKGQERLVDFVKRGGKLFIAPIIPTLDENFNPCTILKDFLGAGSFEKHIDPVRLNAGAVENILANGSLFVTSDVPSGAQVYAKDERSGKIAGWRIKRGAGEVLWFGLAWKHAKKSHSRLIDWVLGEFGVSTRAVCCNNPFVWTVLRSDGDRSMLFAMNLFSSPVEATIAATYQGSQVDEQKIKLAPMEVRTFELKKQ